MDETGVSTEDVPDASLPEGARAAPCQIRDAFLQIEDEAEAQAAMRLIASPLDMDLEDAPLDDEGATLATEEPLPTGASLASLMESIKKMPKNVPQKLKDVANEIEQMQLLFNKVKDKVGPEQFTGFLSLFSLASRKGNNNNEKGRWEVTLNGRKIDAGEAEFKVTFILKNDYQYRTIYSGDDSVQKMPRGNNVFRIGGTFCNDNFEIIVSPEFTRYHYLTEAKYTYPDLDEQGYSAPVEEEYNDKLLGIDPTQYKTLDELAELLINEIYDTIRINNRTDWWTDKTLTALEIAVTAAVICTGVGGVLAAGSKALRVAYAGLVVLESANVLEAGTRFLGLTDKGYNPILEGMRYLDGKASSGHKFQAVFHGLNMVMAFGKKPTTRYLTAFGSGTSTASAYIVLTDIAGGIQQPILSYEDAETQTEKGDE